MVKKPEGGEFFQIGPDGKPTDTALHAALLGDDDKNTWDPNDPRQLAAKQAEVKARVEARKRREARTKPPREGELSERGPDGKPTDARIWDAMLNGDTEPGFDGMDPEVLKKRRKEYGELSESEPAGPRDRAETPYVLFLRTTDHGQQPAGRAVLTGDRVTFHGVAPDLVQEMERGVRVGRRALTPADGEAFLRALPIHYTGSYFRAKYVGRRSR